MTYQTNSIPKLALGPPVRLTTVPPKPRFSSKGRWGDWLKKEDIKVVKWPKL